MTLNIGGGFSLLRCASNMVSSLCCAMPPKNRTSRHQTRSHPNRLGGVGAMRQRAHCGAKTLLDHGLARTQQPYPLLLTGLSGPRKRRAVFGFRLSVCRTGDGVVEFQAWLG